MPRSDRPLPEVRLVPGSLALFDADQVGDHVALAGLLGVAPLVEWPPVGGEHDADAVAFFRGALAADPSASEWLAFYVCVDGALVGSAGFMGPPVGGTTEIGYSICQSHRRRGIATAAVGALVRRARAAGATRLSARVEPGNGGSIEVLTRNGFVAGPHDLTDGDNHLHVELDLSPGTCAR